MTQPVSTPDKLPTAALIAVGACKRRRRYLNRWSLSTWLNINEPVRWSNLHSSWVPTQKE